MPLDKPVPAIRTSPELKRHLPVSRAKQWLLKGWDDFRYHNMEASLLYGVVITALSAVIVGGLFVLKLDYILFPALAAFMVIGPLLAVGLYEKSRRLEQGKNVSIGNMLAVQPRSSKDHFLFTGLLLSLWIMLWLRAGVLLYALFFGMRDFPGPGGVLKQIFTEPAGYALLLTGTLFGALFAAFGFAISVISVPMLLDEETDAFSAMGSSIALVWHNLPVMLAWGAIVAGLVIVCLFTGMIGLIFVFPVLGHATWHMYREVRGDTSQSVLGPAIHGDEISS